MTISQRQIDEALSRLARPKVKASADAPGGTGRLCDVIGLAAATDYYERQAADRLLLMAALQRQRKDRR